MSTATASILRASRSACLPMRVVTMMGRIASYQSLPRTDTVTMPSQQQPIVIPIHLPQSSSTPPEWAMIDINGELVLPPEDDETETTNDLVSSADYELGSIRFEGEVRAGKRLNGRNRHL